MSIALTLVSAALLACAAPEHSERDPLDAYSWSSRPLVVLAPSPDDARVAEMRKRVAAHKEGFAERDMVLLEATGSDARSRALRERLEVPTTAFAVILVGKDGGVKLRKDAPVALADVFALIDTMPMRRDEMRRPKR